MTSLNRTSWRYLRALPTLIHPAVPAGRTIFMVAAFLALIWLGAEIMSRTYFFSAHVVPTDWGSSHSQLELQLGRLHVIAAAKGKVDCIFLGNSMVLRGFEPEVFAHAYHEQTGRELRCFNFGVDGMPASSAGELASTLVQDFEPQFFIYGVDARDLAVPRHARDAAVLLETPWIRYRHGQFSLQGWLYEHIRFWRYRESLARLSRFEDTYLIRKGLGSDVYGFVGDETVGRYIDDSPLEHQELGHVRYYLDLLSDYRVLPENVHGLQRISALNGPATQVIFVEMPTPDTYLEFFGNGEQDYDRFVEQVAEISALSEIAFLRTHHLQLVPEDGWVDYSHLNVTGARRFSRWIAAMMAQRSPLASN